MVKSLNIISSITQWRASAHANSFEPNDYDILLGLGYLVNGFENYPIGVRYSDNAFYRSNIKVSGNIVQKFIFTELAYCSSVIERHFRNALVSHLIRFQVLKYKIYAKA